MPTSFGRIFCVKLLVKNLLLYQGSSVCCVSQLCIMQPCLRLWSDSSSSSHSPHSSSISMHRSSPKWHKPIANNGTPCPTYNSDSSIISFLSNPPTSPPYQYPLAPLPQLPLVKEDQDFHQDINPISTDYDSTNVDVDSLAVRRSTRLLGPLIPLCPRMTIRTVTRPTSTPLMRKSPLRTSRMRWWRRDHIVAAPLVRSPRKTLSRILGTIYPSKDSIPDID